MSDVIHYLTELRSRLLRCLLVITAIFAILCFFSNKLYDLFSIPLLKHLPNKTLIAIGIPSPFTAPLKLTLILAIFIAAPYWLSQIYAFIAPALYRHERRLISILLIVGSVLFYAGITFGYFVILPMIFAFFIHTAPASVEVKPDINQFLDFSLKLLFVFGLAFEVPIFTLLLILSGITSVENLKKKRPFIIVGVFIIAMLLTPPDILSQICLAIPLWLLFELGLLLTRFVKKSVTQAKQIE